MDAREPVVPLTAQEINALPERVRHYIMWLETETDPAGIVQNNYRLTQENLALRALFAEQRSEGVMRAEQSRQTASKENNEAAERFIQDARAFVAASSQATGCTCPSGGGSLAWPCPVHEIKPTQRSVSTRWTEVVDNDAIRQLMYRAEADFHRASKTLLSKREQGHVMGMFRTVVSAFVLQIFKPKE